MWPPVKSRILVKDRNEKNIPFLFAPMCASSSLIPSGRQIRNSFFSLPADFKTDIDGRIKVSINISLPGFFVVINNSLHHLDVLL